MQKLQKISVVTITPRSPRIETPPSRYSFSDSNIFGVVGAIFAVTAIALLILRKHAATYTEAKSLQVACIFAFLVAVVTGMWSSLKFANVVLRKRAEERGNSMSWDIYIVKFSKPYATVKEIPDEERSELGTRVAVQKALSEIFPTIKWRDDGWGSCDHEYGFIDFNVGNDDPVDSMMLLVRAASADVVPDIVQLCMKNGWQGIDTSTSDGGFIERAQDPAAGLKRWSDYRDQVIEKF